MERIHGDELTPGQLKRARVASGGPMADPDDGSGPLAHGCAGSNEARLEAGPARETADGFRAVAAPPQVLAPDHEAQLARSVAPVHLVKAGAADVHPRLRRRFRREVRAARVDRERLAGRFAAQRGLEPLLLPGEADGVDEGEVVAH